MRRIHTYKFKFKCQNCGNIFIEELNKGNLYFKNSYTLKKWGWYCSQCKKDKNKLNKNQEFKFPKLNHAIFTTVIINAERVRYAFFEKIMEMEDLKKNEKTKLLNLIKTKLSPSYWRNIKYIPIDKNSGKGLIRKYYSDELKYRFKIFYDNPMGFMLNLTDKEIEEWKDLKGKIINMLYL